MPSRRTFLVSGAVLAALSAPLASRFVLPRPAAAAAQVPALRFAVTAAPGLLPKPVDGRVIVMVGPAGSRDMRGRLDDPEATDTLRFGADAARFSSASPAAVVDVSRATAFPADAPAKLTPGTYTVQAALLWNPDLRLPDAPGNLYSKPAQVTLTSADLSSPKPLAITLTEQEPPESLPKDDGPYRYVRLQSRHLSKFWKRPMFLRAGVVLPSGFDTDPKTRRYALRVHIGGFNTRYTTARFLAPHPAFVQVVLDGAGPLGDPYQVNSANNGPYGDAVIKELIPLLEKKFRCGGSTWARFTDGGSTGGWVSFALQAFYPKTFGGCWSGYPDPLDFRAYETINLYDDVNAYADTQGQDRPSARVPLTNRVKYTVRQECQVENVLAPGGNYAWGSAGQWGVWNAVFGAPGKNGKPVPLWDPMTGAIDKSQLAQWRKYDLRDRLETHWKKLGPDLRGKIHLWVGTRDDYFLDAGVHRMDDFLKTTQDPPADARVVYGELRGHGWSPQRDSEIQDEMASIWRAHGGGKAAAK